MDEWRRVEQAERAGRLKLDQEEAEVLAVSGVGIDVLEHFSRTTGTLLLTTQRLAWVPEKGSALAIALTDVLSVAWGRKPGDNAWFLPTKSARLALRLISGSFYTLALRQRRPASLVNDIRTAVDRCQQRAREQQEKERTHTEIPQPRTPGIGGALREAESEASATQLEVAGVSSADLQELASRGSRLVDLANHLRRASSTREEGEREFDSVLEEAGLGAAQPSNSSELARELVDALQPLTLPIMLPEAFCRLNRRRGVSLASPQDVLNAAKALPEGGPQLISLPSANALAIAPPGHALLELSQRVAAECSSSSAITEASAGEILSVPVALAKEALLQAERDGGVCRDESPHDGIVRFYRNIFLSNEERSY